MGRRIRCALWDDGWWLAAPTSRCWCMPSTVLWLLSLGGTYAAVYLVSALSPPLALQRLRYLTCKRWAPAARTAADVLQRGLILATEDGRLSRRRVGGEARCGWWLKSVPHLHYPPGHGQRDWRAFVAAERHGPAWAGTPSHPPDIHDTTPSGVPLRLTVHGRPVSNHVPVVREGLRRAWLCSAPAGASGASPGLLVPSLVWAVCPLVVRWARHGRRFGDCGDGGGGVSLALGDGESRGTLAGVPCCPSATRWRGLNSSTYSGR